MTASQAVAVIGFAEAPEERRSAATTNGTEMLVPIIADVLAATGLKRSDIGFWCSGSSDYLAGRAFSFVSAVDAIGAVPPVAESHVEMDAAWALYEAWLKILAGEAEVALVYGFGKSSAGRLRRVLALQLDPYLAAPLWPDSIAIAALQARAGIDAGLWTEHDLAAVAIRSHQSGLTMSRPLARSIPPAAALLERPYLADPLHAHDCAPVTDGAAVVVLAAASRAERHCERPAWITGFEHRVDSGAIGARDLTAAPSAAAAGAAAGAADAEVAELHAPFTHQEIILRRALRLGDDTVVSPSGGALCGNPMFAAGLARIGWAARAIISGHADVALGHATSGPALQQNLVCVLEATPEWQPPIYDE
jgi:acetyl-CoA acetyltransferase